jgi:hypothetical protein
MDEICVDFDIYDPLLLVLYGDVIVMLNKLLSWMSKDLYHVSIQI